MRREDGSFVNRYEIERYLVDIKKIPPIGINEEIELLNKIRNGDEEAKTELVKSHCRFVVRISSEYFIHEIPLGDLVSVGNLGLIKALKKYDETRGFKFISYAVWWIRAFILKEIDENGKIICMSTSTKNDLNKINKFISKYENTYGYPPAEWEIAEGLEFSEEYVGKIKRYGMIFVASFNKEIGDNLILENIFSSEDDSQTNFDREELSLLVNELLSYLRESDKIFLKIYCETPNLPLSVAAEKAGMSLTTAHNRLDWLRKSIPKKIPPYLLKKLMEYHV
jgi:RNA polymerase primary sigma factor